MLVHLLLRYAHESRIYGEAIHLSTNYMLVKIRAVRITQGIFFLTLLCILETAASVLHFLQRQGRTLSFCQLDVSNSDQQMFLESLICRMDDDCDKLLICKLDLDCKKTLCFDSEVHEQDTSIPQDVAFGACRTDMPSTYYSGKSPFPALDAFVESIASSGNVSGKIRCWYWFSAEGLIIYSMLRNRYCERIGREHKSNHVMYIVDFQRAGYYQKCYDPDCKGYRSPLRQLPWNVIPDSMEVFNLTRTGDMNDTESTNIDFQHDENNMGYYLCDNNEWNSESWKTESSWWQEATKYADCIENMKNGTVFRTCSDMDEDSEWWMDAEKIVSQVEEQFGSQ